MEATEGENIYHIGSFKGMTTGDTFKIGQIGLDGDFSTWNNDWIATIDAFGAQDQYYSYDDGWFVADADGVVDYDQPAEDIELPINVGLIVYSSLGSKLVYSGEVISGDTELYTVEGDNAYTGNFTPTVLKLGDIVVDGDFSTWNNDWIATIDSAGAQKDYFSCDEGIWYVADSDGVVDYDQPANDHEFAPNEGFIIYTSLGATLNIPSPIK